MAPLRIIALLSLAAVASAAPPDASTDPPTAASSGTCRRARRADDRETRCAIASSEECDNKYAKAYYCAPRPAGYALCALYACWLGLLFVLLGSTADEYFSPALEQLSEDAGLPPRFAGVTLLALGNGAPDVSSTIHAVASSEDGYQLALGALTGAGMFVGTCVAGCVMVVADGAKAQGALLRDVSAYLLAATGTMWLVGVRKVVSVRSVALLLGAYATFVLAVLAADLWHRRPGGPHERQQAARREAAEPDAVELMLTLIHDVRRRGPGRAGPARVGKATDEEKSSAERPQRNPFYDDDDDPDVPRARAASDPLATPRASRVVIEGDDFGLGSPLDGGAFEAPLLESDEPASPTGSGAVPQPLVVDLASRTRATVEAAVGAPWPWKVTAVAELPFVALRAATVPLTARESYALPTFCLALLGAPLWLCVYAARRGVEGVFGGAVPPVLLAGLGGLAAAAAAAKLAAGRDALPFWPALVFALVGFLVAATWIDVFADELVQALEFFGVALGVPDPVLGLTVLAWGNSVGDLSTNVAMAKKGLANMALTACFAGPVFNMLVGLGAGFWVRLAKEKASSVDVHLDRGLRVGFVMIAANCALVVAAGVLMRGRIPRKFGFLSLSLYAVYMVLSLATLFAGDAAA